jgi:quinolinate synthase
MPKQIRDAKKKHPGAPFVIYVNSSAACKAESDITCTSSNAVDIVRSLPEREILFGPDRNLAAFVQQKVPEKIIIPVPDDGTCPVHNKVKPEDIMAARQIGGFILCHPECPPEVTCLCDAALSTGKMREAISDHDVCHIFTEASMLYLLQKAWPEKVLYGFDTMVCEDMQKTTPEALLACITQGMYDVSVDEQYAQRARAAIERMLTV